MTLSSISAYTMESVAEAMNTQSTSLYGTPCLLLTLLEYPDCGGLWFQLYVFKRRDITEQLIRRVEKAGYRYRDLRRCSC
jgi:hypothetical protein